MSTALNEARAALRARQGLGARYDAPGAPSRELDWARRGTAYFARLLNNLPDEALDAPSRILGFSRRRLIASVGYQARLLSEIVAWARTGQTGPFPKQAAISPDDLEFGVTQPSRALRYLFEHSAIHLNVEWRDLSEGDWDLSVTDLMGKTIKLRDTPLQRARTIWQHAVDLDAGGRMSDIPQAMPRSS
ncbi:maleylpyruvate isomerase N-terminal domain-containing protein [Rhizobium sp. C4]|uniref:maleylpyruvate isomerase N-terminal domain-containing protein n=1 Tax=Rhizobium sp. C4 TaxID=1349800 RepID=UPI001E5B3D01|nr:maleylpyruvate isomerase N-terminal domain-containing protein [Rhizobium sp. C4]MCD2172114.1 maleylpyruvate isomerase N-terminal domain-containing protein [Rhizobium sp. C4]